MKQKVYFFGRICIFLPLFCLGIFGQTETTETHELIEIQGSHNKMVGRPIQVIGKIELSNLYAGEFKNAQNTHYVFMLKSPSEYETAFVYMKHGEKADRLQTKLLSMEQNPKLDGTFTIFIKKGGASKGYVSAELLDFTLDTEKPSPPKIIPKNPFGIVVISYDKFKDETTITGIAHLLDCQDRSITEPTHTDFGATITFTGKKPTTIPTVELKLRLFGDIPDSAPEFIFFADDKRLTLGKGSSAVKSYRIAGLSLSESISNISIPFDSFKAIANSKKVEAKIGQLEFAPPFIESEAIQRILPVFREMLIDLEKQ